MAVATGLEGVESRDAAKHSTILGIVPHIKELSGSKMAIVLRLRSPALEEQGENANRFEKGLARTINSFREPGMYLTIMVDVVRTTVPSHDLLELVDGYSRLDLVCFVYPACPLVSEKTSSKTKHICYSAQRNFHFDCSSHQESILGILGSGMV